MEGYGNFQRARWIFREEGRRNIRHEESGRERVLMQAQERRVYIWRDIMWGRDIYGRNCGWGSGIVILNMLFPCSRY